MVGGEVQIVIYTFKFGFGIKKEGVMEDSRAAILLKLTAMAVNFA